MIYNDTTNGTGIIQACEDYCGLGSTGISGDTPKLKEFTRYTNRAGRKIRHWIFLAQGLWNYDDSNETDLPIATTNLVSGTSGYALPDEALTIQRIEIKDSNDDWYQLTQIIPQEIGDGIDDFMEDDGTPLYYRTIGNTINLFPAPDFNKTGGLKVYFDRASVDFVYTDTTKTPGFASIYHDLIAIGASVEWLKAHRPDTSTIVLLQNDWTLGEKEIKDFYSLRNKDLTPVLRRKHQSYR